MTYQVFIDDSILPGSFYLDECQHDKQIEYHLLDSFYSNVLEPFIFNNLLDIYFQDDEYHISITKNIPVVSFYTGSLYIRLPYHKDFTFENYFLFFGLLYSMLSTKSVCFINSSKIPVNKYEYDNFIVDIFMMISNCIPKINSYEIYNGTLLELEASEQPTYVRSNYTFNVVNSMG